MTQTHSEQTARGEVEVTQVDRDAAADYLNDCGWDWGACGDIREGRISHSVVQAFARHRLASLSPAENGALGEADHSTYAARFRLIREKLARWNDMTGNQKADFLNTIWHFECAATEGR